MSTAGLHWGQGAAPVARKDKKLQSCSREYIRVLEKQRREKYRWKKMGKQIVSTNFFPFFLMKRIGHGTRSICMIPCHSSLRLGFKFKIKYNSLKNNSWRFWTILIWIWSVLLTFVLVLPFNQPWKKTNLVCFCHRISAYFLLFFFKTQQIFQNNKETFWNWRLPVP